MAEIMVALSSDDQTISVPLATVFGTGIARIEQTVASDDPEIPNEITCTLTNGQQSKFYIKNGKDGYSPSITIEQGAEGYSITVTDEEGSHEYSIIVDSTLDAESANPIQNQAVAGAVTQLTSDIAAEVTRATNAESAIRTEASQVYATINALNAATTTVEDDSITVDKLASDTIALINRKSGLTEDIKQALLNCFKFVAFINDQGQSYVDALEDALYSATNVASISASFNQGANVIYDNASLDDLKQYLTVIANYTDSTHETLSDYTLSGILEEGTSTITVSYGGKTTTFTVNVTALVLTSIRATFTQGSAKIHDTNTLDSLKQYLTVTARYSDGTSESVSSTDYTLSGTLEEGTSTITVSYGGMTDTFNVTVTQGKSDMNEWTDGVAYTDLEIVQNEYVDRTDGSFDPYTGWNRTGYVPINGASTLSIPKLSGTGGSTRYNAFYSADKTWISSFDIDHGTGVRTVNVPANAYYFVLSEKASEVAYWIENGIVPHA